MGCFCGVLEGMGSGVSFTSPKNGVFVRFRVQERSQNRKTVAGDEIEDIFKKSRVFGRRIDEAQNVRQLLVWVTEEWTNVYM